jgi:glucose/arabinose dehydrogenase
MKSSIMGVVVIVAFSLAGCSLLSPATPTPTRAPTAALFIRVPSPTSPPGATPSLTPTDAAPTQEITATLDLPTPTPTDTPTPTPTPPTVRELPDPSGYSWQTVVSGLDRPVGLVDAGDGSGRLFILEQGGLIRILQEGILLSAPFLDLTQRVSCCGERGLLGLAFHPRFIENGYFYVDYTEVANNQLYTVVARYSVLPGDPNLADAGSEMRLLHIEQPYQNHNGGEVQFGLDGYLYVGMGDGGSAGDPHGNGQSLTTLLGKILRLDVDAFEPYAIPPDNPFVNTDSMWEIWAYGLRNPWRFSFDTRTGDIYISDVGQDAWEEISFLAAGNPGGTNFGWNYYEGNHSYRGSPPPDANIVMPVAEYGHELGNSITGGYVYRGFALPAWQGVYLYGDFGSGRVWGLLRLEDGSWQNALMFETSYSVSSFGQDWLGNIYLVDYGGQILILR